MTDDQLCDFLNVTEEQFAQLKANGHIDQARAVYEKMFDVELWDMGVGPVPDGVIVCGPREVRQSR